MNKQRSMPNWLDAATANLPKLFKTPGYATGRFGKWRLGGVGAPLPDRYEFDAAR